MNKKSILVVDNDPNIINNIFEMLKDKSDQYTFYQAINGKIAYQAASDKKPDIIITDWDMPEINGIQLIKMLKTNPETTDIPIIMATGIMTSSTNLKTALDAGAVDYIRKPIDGIELLSRVNSMLLLSSSIKEVKSKNQTIKEKNIFLRELINAIPQPIANYDKSGKLLDYNKTFRQVFNIANNEMENQPIYNLFMQDGVDIHFQNDKKLIEEGAILNYESVLTYPDQSKHDILFTKAPFHDEFGDVKGIICILNDITEIKKVYREAVEQQKKELANASMRLIQSCELNEKIISDINSILPYTNKNGEKIIREIITNGKFFNNDSIWSEFEIRFNEVYKDFYEKLNRSHPDLSTNERKLCAFLRLNMSSKEIASITFQSPKSIDMARYRLRKKLNLDDNKNLIAYISSI